MSHEGVERAHVFAHTYKADTTSEDRSDGRIDAAKFGWIARKKNALEG